MMSNIRKMKWKTSDLKKSGEIQKNQWKLWYYSCGMRLAPGLKPLRLLRARIEKISTLCCGHRCSSTTTAALEFNIKIPIIFCAGFTVDAPWAPHGKRYIGARVA